MSNLYENPTYEVVLSESDSEFPRPCYAVVNKATGIVEMLTFVLPEALHTAVHWDIDVTQENHLWPYKKQEEAENAKPIEEVNTLQ